MSNTSKRIIIGICGSIAAYKIAYLIRLLSKEGYAVQVIMTPEAKAFVGPLTFSTLSKNPVIADFYNEQTGLWNNHVELGLWGDVFLIAPATANTIAKMATGNCDNVLMATYLSSKCPVLVAPAMDLDMWKHPTTQQNIKKITSFGNKIINPEIGELASGLTGEGRMAEPESLLMAIKNALIEKKLLGKKILITAGPTQEKIDPVRFISNYSSGKMGFALANACAQQGAEVTLISGPVESMALDTSITRIDVESAEDMYAACDSTFSQCDIFIAAAAVADFTPEIQATKKIKKSEIDALKFSLQLKTTKDILATMGQRKSTNQIVIGFALETNNEFQNAQLKLKNKNLDFIIVNSLNEKGSGFKHDTNKISILDKNNKLTTFELKSKTAVADDIVNYLIDYSHA